MCTTVKSHKTTTREEQNSNKVLQILFSVEERCFQLFCWLGLMLCDFINYTHHLINTHLTMLLLPTRHGEWGPHPAQFSEEFFPNFSQQIAQQNSGNTGCGCVLSMHSVCGGYGKGPAPPKRAGVSLKQPLHAHICCVSQGSKQVSQQ